MISASRTLYLFVGPHLTFNMAAARFELLPDDGAGCLQHLSPPHPLGS